MRDSAKLYYGEAARRQAKEKGNEVLLLPMEQVKGQSPEEMSEAWKQLLLQLCRREAPELLRQRGPNAALPARSPWFLYWLLPQLLQAVIERGRSAVWICNYDWPLLCGLRYDFGRYSTELVSAVAEACMQCGLEGLYLTGQLPFPLYRIALTGGSAAESVDEARKAYVRRILEKHFADRGKATWQEWLNYFEKKKRPPAVLGYLDSESLSAPLQWLILARAAGLEAEMPDLLRQWLSGGREVPTPQAIKKRGKAERLLFDMADRWDCQSTEELRQLQRLLTFCQMPDEAERQRVALPLVHLKGEGRTVRTQGKFLVPPPGISIDERADGCYNRKHTTQTGQGMGETQ